ncbi:hypothetical protein BC567DRAFT_295991 [Phyllosticta citribraziliensis]
MESCLRIYRATSAFRRLSPFFLCSSTREFNHHHHHHAIHCLPDFSSTSLCRDSRHHEQHHLHQRSTHTPSAARRTYNLPLPSARATSRRPRPMHLPPLQNAHHLNAGRLRSLGPPRSVPRGASLQGRTRHATLPGLGPTPQRRQRARRDSHPVRHVREEGLAGPRVRRSCCAAGT